jgi:hypothetical protein
MKHLRRLFAAFALLVLAAPALAAPMPAVPASKFYQGIGVDVHAWYVGSEWPLRLSELGVAKVRGKVGTSKDLVTKLQPFFAAGGKITATVVASGSGTLDKAATQKNLAFLKSNVGLFHVAAVEGPNEFNINHTTGWATTERDFVHWLHDTVRADPAFNPVPILPPSVWKRIITDYKALGDLSAWVDKGTIHYYSGQRRPTLTGGNTMAGALRDASILAPGKPIHMTETGWQSPTGNIPITLRAQAKYVLRDYFDAATNGVEEVDMYQMMDDGMAGGDFGLTDAAARPKPSFTALKNLVALVKDTGGSAGVLDYSIASPPPSLRQLLLRRSDGSYLLCLWLDVDSWSRGKDVETMLPVTINLASAAKFEVYQPTFSSAVQYSGSGSQIQWFVGDQVMVVKVGG